MAQAISVSGRLKAASGAASAYEIAESKVCALNGPTFSIEAAVNASNNPFGREQIQFKAL
jgi:hypothetical protein